MSKNRPLKKFAVLLLLTAGVALASSWLMPREIIDWRSDLPAARAESRATRKPIVLYFTASWCEPCQRMKKTTWADANVKDALSRFVPVKIDIDQHADLAQQYGVKSIPRLILLDDAGAAMKIRTGLAEPRELIAWLREL